MGDKRIKLMQVVNGLRVGGAELKLLELINELDREKFDISICSLEDIGTLKDDFRNTGYPLYILPRTIKFDFSLISKLSRLMRQQKVDLVMTTLFYADVIGSLAARMAHVPVCVSWETRSHPKGSGVGQPRHIYSYRTAMKYVKKIVSVSDAVKKFLIEERNIPESKITTIRYGIDIDKYRKTDGSKKRSELGYENDTFLIGVVARLSSQKGHTYLLDAIPDIIRDFPKARFIFIGDGPLRQELEEKSRHLELDEVVTFLGSRTDVPELLNSLDMFVLPSLYEGLPNVVLEAMASQKAIVATAVDGTPEAIIHEQSGLLVQPREPEQLALAIKRIMGDRDLKNRLELGARSRAEKEFSLKGQVKKFENLYEELMNGGTNGSFRF
ncbi:glycosyltransferase [candidate division KSB1 bacterium]|nr:glycosyltransferase [candidate division KSB1 bacterium]